jgi:hypothetical protein
MIIELSLILFAAIVPYNPAGFDAIFGDADEFIQNIEDDVAPKLNEYLGLLVAVTGFTIVARSLSGGR